MRVAVLLVSLVAMLLPASAAAHGGAIDDAVETFETTPVYVDPNADPTISDARARSLADRIGSTGRPIYIAVLDEQDDAPHDVVHELVEGLGKPGTYVTVVAGRFGVHSTEFAHERAEEIAARADARPPGELAATLDGVVADVESTPALGDDEDTPWGWIVVGLVGIALVATALTMYALRRRRPAPR